MPVTIKDVAAAAGMSVAAVSQILNGTAVYREESIKRVKAAVRRLGYRPNASARATSLGRFGSCALLMPSGHEISWLPGGLLSSLESTLSAANCHLVLGQLPDPGTAPAGQVPKVLGQLMVDGAVIVDSPHIQPATLRQLKASRIPLVFLNTEDANDAVRPDDRAGGRAATEILLGHGHRDIAFADYLREADSPREGRHFSQYHRWEGYQAAMAAAGLQPRFIGSILGEALDFSRAWLRRADRPTAVVLYSIDILIPILLAMAEEGLRPGRDLSLIAFGSENWFGRMNLDVMLLPGREIGSAAAGMLLAKITSKKRLPSREIAMTYAAGSMVGAPPAR